ncbi:hypothetical protein [Marinobacterium aestuariivivens]|uniref:ESPR domain-containing protein n=1 Tax=Marinobacterium aestuariivivens TaxID=1698799 RepID=A0ABW1ZW10_9GAMM
MTGRRHALRLDLKKKRRLVAIRILASSQPSACQPGASQDSSSSEAARAISPTTVS